MRVLRRLFRARRGSATVEFGLLSLFFFGIAMVALDFGFYVQQKLKLGSAVEQGAIFAFNTRDAINPTNVTNLVKTAASLPGTPTVSCNNNVTCVALASRSTNDYRCIDQTTGVIGTTAYAVGAACSGGGTAGYYLKIVATRTYNAMIVPDKWLNGTALTQTAVVRLQ